MYETALTVNNDVVREKVLQAAGKLGKGSGRKRKLRNISMFCFFLRTKARLKAFCRILRVKIKIGKPPYRTIYAENAMAGFTAPVTGANAGIRFRPSVDPIHFARLTGDLCWRAISGSGGGRFRETGGCGAGCSGRKTDL